MCNKYLFSLYNALQIQFLKDICASHFKICSIICYNIFISDAFMRHKSIFAA